MDKKLFRVGEKEAQFMQQSQCWTLEAVFRAIENAGLKLEQLQGSRYACRCNYVDPKKDNMYT
jgi:acyl transferase domain-containing protein